MGGFKIWFEILVSIFYCHNIVGVDTYFIYTKMGGAM